MPGLELCVRIFVKALLAYAVLTLPLVFVSGIYVFSLYLAFVFGVFVFILFAPGFYFLKRLKVSRAYDVLYLALLFMIALAYHVGVTLVLDENPWDAGVLIFLPIAAVVAGWVALYISRLKITEYFNEDEHAQAD